MPTRILGISCYYHDSAAALIVDGEIVAAAQEERFSRVKHDPGFPAHAINFCLAHQNLQLRDVDYIVFYDKPFVKFERLLETYLAFAPRGFRSFLASMPVWLKDKLFLKATLRREFTAVNNGNKQLPKLLFSEHHEAHAASAFFPSPFERAAVLCLDGVGEWATTSVWQGESNQLTPLWEIRFPHSLGLLYSAFTYYTGFKVNSGEYKLMGLAPYGEPRYVDVLLDHVIDLKADGTFHLEMSYFDFATGLTMTSTKLHSLFDGPPRQPESEISQREMDIARSIQVVTEEVVLRLANTIHEETGNTHLCLAGGVALNCVANGRLQRETAFESIWIQPAAGDAGGAPGAALTIWHQYLGHDRDAGATDKMNGAYLGKTFSDIEIAQRLQAMGAISTQLPPSQLLRNAAGLIADGNVVGWFNGAAEFGPRALGNRSILGDARIPEMQSVMNLKIKNRESFRPFAPAVLAEQARDWFDLAADSPYMLLVAHVHDDHTIIPAVTHVDGSARVQTVHQETNPAFHGLLSEFMKLTGCPVLINTSFNVRGEPIVNSPEDAYRCFMVTDMDFLVLGDRLLAKADQPAWTGATLDEVLQLD